MNKSVTVTLFLDKRSKSLEKGIGMIKVNVYHNYKNKLFTTGNKAPEKEWKTLQRSIDENGLSGKVKNEYVISMYQELYENPNSDLNRAKKIVEQLGDDFSFEAFRYYFENPKQSVNKVENNKITDVLIALQKVYQTLEEEDRTNTASGYDFACKSLIRFIDSLDLDEKTSLGLPIQKNNISLPFKSLTAKFLQKYEKWMLRYGKAPKSKNGTPSPATTTTIGIYLRNVRSVFNTAITEKVVSQEDYPFNNYTVPSGQNKKKSLLKSDIEKILNYIPDPDSFEQRSWSLWVFSYLSNGMNFSDICRLRKEDVDYKNKTITFVRKKTRDTTKSNRKEITTMLFPQLIPLMESLKNTNSESKLFFPFLNDAETEKRKIAIIKQIIKVTNKHMNRIAKKLNIDADLDSYSARHSFATILLRSGAPLPFISQSLGHGSISTTQNYLGSFEDDQVKEYLNALL